MDYYRSDLAQALIRHERSLQVTLHQVKLIGKDKCASENLQVLHFLDITLPIVYVLLYVGSDTRDVCMSSRGNKITSTVKNT